MSRAAHMPAQISCFILLLDRTKDTFIQWKHEHPKGNSFH